MLFHYKAMLCGLIQSIYQFIHQRRKQNTNNKAKQAIMYPVLKPV